LSSFEEAKASALTATRRYAKRQYTWFNRNMISWKILDEQFYYRKNSENDILFLFH